MKPSHRSKGPKSGRGTDDNPLIVDVAIEKQGSPTTTKGTGTAVKAKPFDIGTTDGKEGGGVPFAASPAAQSNGNTPPPVYDQ